VTTCSVIKSKYKRVMYETAVNKKRRYVPSVHIKRQDRLPYSNAGSINSVTYQEQLISCYKRDFRKIKTDKAI
jgi:hypothetical protein